MNTSSAKAEALTLVGDASLFTATSFCLLAVIAGPLALVIGPAVAWLLHQRRFNAATLLSEIVGLLLSLGVLGGGYLIVVTLLNTLWPESQQDFTAPLMVFIGLSSLFLMLIIGLDLDGLRDLLSARRQHLQLDYARLAATGVIVVFAIIIALGQWLYPETEIGDAGIFALGAALIGAATMLVMKPLNSFWEERSGSLNR